MTRVHNFSSGPAVLPEPVLRQAQAELLDWGGRGLSVLETSHRVDAFVAIMQESEALVRELLAVPANYRILFMQGGGHQQFAMVPLNLLGPKTRADYIVTGYWSARARAEAQRFCDARAAADTESSGYTRVPAADDLRLDPQAAYVYYCSNETIHGIEFDYVPATGALPLVADASSHFLSAPVDVSRYGVLYACAQKNFGPAGVTAVIIRDDLVGHCPPRWPTLLDYKTYADHASMYNTPVTFAMYLAHLVLRWLRAEGGVKEMHRRSLEKSAMLYAAIDGSGGFYANPIAPAHRSRMNVPFSLRDDRLSATFLQEAEAGGMVQLKGHRSVGGMRASLYNALPLAAVEALTDFMRDFARRHG